MSGKKTLVEKKTKSGVSYWTQAVGDRTYPIFEDSQDGDYNDVLQAVRDLKLKSRDVWVAGYPKSGNHWFYEAINMCCHQSKDYTARLLVQDLVDAKAPEAIGALPQEDTDLQFFSHLNLDTSPKALPGSGAKVIYIVRNIKDVITSTFHFTKALVAFQPFRGTWEDFFDICMSPQGYCYGTWFDHVQQADVFRKSHPDVPFHILCYESMKTNPVEEVRKLCGFLEVDDQFSEEIAEKLSFKTMKPELMAGKMQPFVDAVCEKGSTGLYRKGEIGDWKNLFTVAQSEAVDRVMEERFKDSPIGQMVKPYCT